ncbi:MAG: hypothetical protein BWY04_01016 [candidate division CPR1 bacterium ADurb.Bin160]|uniref:Proliferating cell nuclear antigen n=1 Tax=candidate division CPR1 bacterium ADurb.Bin160 TaxID=1852826 RepID=A0A1V5ZLJ6_9BACT|nr:MAG: hypothetical protein BWY04_01016 [candidate division CPR1 bacterium ADurb.Bin160]
MNSDMTILTKNQFLVFLRVLNIFKDICKDVDMRGGVIRQRTNSRHCTIEVDLSEMIKQDLPFVKIKEKLELFNCFVGQGENNIEIQRNLDENMLSENFYVISDGLSKFIFKTISLNFIENVFMSEEEKNNIFILDDNNLILDFEIPKNICDRIKTTCKVFDVNSVTIIFEEENAKIITKTENTEQTAIFIKNIPTLRPCNFNASLSSLPFILDHDDLIRLKIYKTTQESGNEISLHKFETKISDINISTYSMSYIL